MNTIAVSPRVAGIWVSLCAVFLFILLSAAGASKPLNLDSSEFPPAAERTAQTGRPVFYHSEQVPDAIALYHPPLYVYSLAAWMRLFGPGETPVRLFGMTFAILQGLMALVLIATLFGRETAWRWMPWFWVLFLLNPYTVQVAAIADIDSTIYGPLLCAALWATLRLSWRDGERRTDPIGLREYGLVAAVLFLCLWAKLTTVILVFPFVFLLLIERVGVRRAALVTAGVTVSSIVAFAISYQIYGVVTGLDVGFTYRFTWMSFTHRGSSGSAGLMGGIRDRLQNLTGMFPFMVRWIGLVPWMGAAASIGVAGVRFWRTRDLRSLDYGLVLLLAMLSSLYYCAQVYTFGHAPFKYVFVFWGALLTSALYLVDAAAPRAGVRGWVMGGLGVLYAGAAAWAMLDFRDVLMLNMSTGPYRTLHVAVPAVALMAALALSRRWAAARIGVATALTFYCGVQTGIAISQSRAPYSTTYDYGQLGFEDTVAFLRFHTQPGDLIVSMKDIGHTAKRRFFENYPALTGSPAEVEELMVFIRSRCAAYVVFTEERGQDQLILRPQLREWVRSNCRLVASFGNYRIYQFVGEPAAAG